MESRSPGAVAGVAGTPFYVCWRFALTSLFLVMALTLASCQKATSHDDPIVARDDASFEEWISNHAKVLMPSEVRELNEARQQIRFQVMQAKTGLPTDEFAKAVYDDINGKTVRDLLLTSYALQIDRLSTEFANLQGQMKRFENAEGSRRLDDEEKAYAANSISTLRQKMQQREDELARIKARVEELKRAPATEAK